MEFSSLQLDTSLDLNSNPLRVLDEAPPPPPLPPLPLPKQEAESKFNEFRKNATFQEDRVALMEELNRVSAENKKLTEMLTVMSENYTELRNQVVEYTSKNTSSSRKRKLGEMSSINNNNNNVNGTSNGGPSESSSSDEDSSKKPREEDIKAKISRVQVRTEASDTSLIVKDGYQWRKYGQKVTRDNPSPRAYFKCSFAPTCPVKKKVQRSIQDQSIVVATYEGEHNHPHPSKAEANTAANRSLTLGSGPCSAAPSAAPTVTLDLTKPKPSLGGKAEAPHLQHYLAEQMASTLTKDPTFKAALAAAISGKFLQQNNHTEKW